MESSFIEPRTSVSITIPISECKANMSLTTLHLSRAKMADLGFPNDSEVHLIEEEANDSRKKREQTERQGGSLSPLQLPRN